MRAKYLQSKQDSVALLRRVLAEVSRHDAACNPLTFAVWYEHLAGINPRLSAAIAQATAQQPKLNAAAIEQLYQDCIADPDAAATQIAGEELQRVMRGVERSAANTEAQARVYGDRLAEFSLSISSAETLTDTASIVPQLNEVATGTVQMQTVVGAFEEGLRQSKLEIERLRVALDRARVEAITDPLSKLRNRKGFDDVIQQMLLARPDAGTQHHLILFDIDHFKRVNDAHGHAVGDAVIETVGRILARATSGNEASAVAARIGGEEFAVLMRSSTSAQALQLANSVRSLVRAMKVKKRGTQEVIATVTVSAGIAASVPGDDAGSLTAAADDALYRAKNSGRDQVVVAAVG